MRLRKLHSREGLAQQGQKERALQILIAILEAHNFDVPTARDDRPVPAVPCRRESRYLDAGLRSVRHELRLPPLPVVGQAEYREWGAEVPQKGDSKNGVSHAGTANSQPVFQT